MPVELNRGLRINNRRLWLEIYYYLSPELSLVPLCRRLPQQHKSLKVLLVALEMLGKASHIQIIEDSRC
jgi:hypothetical protein